MSERETVYQIRFEKDGKSVRVQKPISEEIAYHKLIAWAREALGMEDVGGMTVTYFGEGDPGFIGRAGEGVTLEKGESSQ